MAWLALHPDGGSREQLAALLWPDDSETSARRNLRQAVYNLRATLTRGGRSYLETSRTHVRLHSDDLWVDVRAFESLLAMGVEGSKCRDPQALISAVQLYHGDLLAGTPTEGGPDLEHWFLFEQERLREDVLRMLRHLVSHLAGRGELAQAALFARRHLDLDPLSEEMHRELMRLYAVTGRRSRALAQYETCVSVLRMELGIEPLEETTGLYESILAQEITSGGLVPELAPRCPSVPLVGRRDAYADLATSFAAALDHGFRIALVTGEEGVGKSRMVKAFLHDIGTRRSTRVLFSRGRPVGLPRPYEVMGDALQSSLDAWAESGRLPPSAGLSAEMAILGLLAPAAAPAGPDAPVNASRVSREEVTIAFADHLKRLLDEPEVEAVVLLCDDLHWADRASLGVLAGLGRSLIGSPVWLVATVRPCEAEEVAKTLRSSPLDAVHLDRLSAADLRQITRSFLAEQPAREIDQLLEERAQGLPLAVVEWINLLCDSDRLVADAPGWSLQSGRDCLSMDPPGDLDGVIAERVRHLPDSTRRLLSLASVFGISFPADVLEAAMFEHSVVLSAGLETLLGHWIVRHSPGHWYASRRERDLVLWSQGVRTGRFEFAHKRVREVVYSSIHPLRRRHLHLTVAHAIEGVYGSRADAAELAWHLLEAGELAHGVKWLLRAAEQAARFDAPEVARQLAEYGLEAARSEDRSSPHGR